VKRDREHDQHEQRGRSACENALGRHRVDATARHGAQTRRASAAQGQRSYGCHVSEERPLSDELVIVANRLPVVRADDGTWEVSPGGLVSALAPIVQAGKGSWIGWAGIPGAPPKAFDHGGMRLTPIGLNAREIEGFYEGFANRTLWPLYHDAVRPPEFRREWWQSYVDTNERFAELTARVASAGATVWVHDYQLHLVPALLRALRPDLRIGFFLHIPLPPQELFMQLPWRQQIVEGMLGADLVGFQRPVAAQNFLQICRRLVDVTPARAQIPYQGRTVRVGAFPVSIDFAEIDGIAAQPETARAARELREALGSPRRILLGVDRLDYTKGIDVRLQAFRELLQSGVTTAGETVLVQVATPSRERVTTYRQLRERVERAVGRINGEFGRLGHPAIHYQHHNLPKEDLCALYAAADVMLVTPLRDGMNLVCKEYVAARHRGGGVLVLSEFAGAAGELRQALLVNPHDVVGLRETIARAIALPDREARRRMREMRRQVRTHDVHRFARTFLEALRERAE
jgi:trehalose 6-phosphate synthase